MNLKDINPIRKPLVLATPAEVDALATQLWIVFPAGYRDYVTKLGEGILGANFVRIYPPWRIDEELVVWRRRIDKYWFWDKGRALLPKERALECVIIGDTLQGDELVFHPARSGHLFVLPRNSEKIFDAGGDLWAAVEWMCSSGKLVRRFADRSFEPFDSRKELAEDDDDEADEVIIDAEGESLDDVVEVAKKWATKHSARKLAHKDLKKNAGPDKKTTLLYEAFVMEGEYPYEPGYLAVYRIDDKKSGLEIGRFTWYKSDDDSEGSEYAPNQANLAKVKQAK